MSDSEVVDRILASAQLAVTLDEDWTLDDADMDLPADADRLWMLLGRAQTLKRAVTLVEKALTQQLGRALPAGEAMRLGDQVYKVAEKMREDMEPGLLDFLGDDWQAAISVSARNIRKTGLDAIAEMRGLDKWTVRDTFLPRTPTGELEVSSLPISRAPKYQQQLEPGESILVKTRKPKEE